MRPSLGRPAVPRLDGLFYVRDLAALRRLRGGSRGVTVTAM
jgi:hypothetical protein